MAATLRVATFDEAAFAGLCAQLMRSVAADFAPTLLVAIPTGGRRVAEAMRHVDSGRVALASLTCRRAGTAAKRGVPGLAALLRRLPRPALDALRVIEHRLTARRPPAAAMAFDPAELAALARALDHPGARVLVVDDAVDSGATLAAVLGEVRARARPDAVVRSAAITVTTAAPLVVPDYSLLRFTLCRFPWSFDAKRQARGPR